MESTDNVSYASRVRAEIFASRPFKNPHYKSFCYGLLLFGKRFDSRAAVLSTEHIEVSRLYGFAVRDTIGVRAAFTEQKTPHGKTLYTVAVTDAVELSRLLAAFNHTEGEANRSLLVQEALPMFLCGAFLACGTVTEPARGYHLELVPPSEWLCDLLFEVLSTLGYPPKSSTRRGATVLYYKESEPIEDLLAMMGAVKCSLELMELKIYRDLRNRANRATNCETANIDKLVRTAQKQIADIKYLRECGALQTLPQELQSLAEIREKSPDASLAELAALCGVSRSGVNHRLARLSEAARRARNEGRNDADGQVCTPASAH